MTDRTHLAKQDQSVDETGLAQYAGSIPQVASVPAAGLNKSSGKIEVWDGSTLYEAGGGGLDVLEVTSNTTMVVDTAYIANKTAGGALEFTLPATAPIGSQIVVVGAGSEGWLVKNDSGNTTNIYSDGTVTTVTSGSSLPMWESNNFYDSVALRCIGANTDWTVEYFNGSRAADLNYFGDESDGSVTISSNTDLTSTLDGDMIVRNYIDLTVNSGQTLSVSNRCKGLLIYCSGNLDVQGTISMTGKGANVDPVAAGVSASGLRIRRLDSVGSDTNSDTDLLDGSGTAAVDAENNQRVLAADGTVFTIARAGAAGGTAVVESGSPGGTAGNPGTSGSTGESGGGGGGSALHGNTGSTTSGAGATGTCFSGGAGGGSIYVNNATDTGNDGGANGGAGGAGKLVSASNNEACGGGAGNNGGAGASTGSGTANAGDNGTGGTLIIIVKGTVTVGASGAIEANGTDGGDATSPIRSGGGGASGGGNIIILHGGSYTNSGTVEAAGGTGGSASGGSINVAGGDGGAGSVQVAQILGQ